MRKKKLEMVFWLLHQALNRGPKAITKGHGAQFGHELSSKALGGGSWGHQCHRAAWGQQRWAVLGRAQAHPSPEGWGRTRAFRWQLLKSGAGVAMGCVAIWCPVIIPWLGGEGQDTSCSAPTETPLPPRCPFDGSFLKPGCFTSQKLAEKVFSGSNLNWLFLPGALL